MKRIICTRAEMIPAHHAEINNGDIVPKSGYELTPLKLRNAALSEKLEETNAGDLVTQEFTAGMKPDDFRKNLTLPLLVNLYDQKGQKYVWGTAKNPVRKSKIQKFDDGITITLKRKTVQLEF